LQKGKCLSVSVALVNVAYAAALCTSENPFRLIESMPLAIPVPIRPHGFTVGMDTVERGLEESGFGGDLHTWEDECRNTVQGVADWVERLSALNKTTPP
jgi:hypothetical protein